MPIFQQKIDVMGFVDTVTHEDEGFNKPYLVLLTEANSYENNDIQDGFREFQAFGIRGRKVAFEHFQEQLGNYDLLHSYVLSGRIALGNEVTLYTFLRLCIEKYFAQSTSMTVEDLDSIAYQTSDVDPEKYDLNVLYMRETGRSAR